MANIPAIPTLHFADRSINQLQQNLVQGIGNLQTLISESPSGGIFITGTTLKTGSNIISQNLTRVPVGFIITDITSASTIYRAAWDNATITLVASAPTKISLYLF